MTSSARRSPPTFEPMLIARRARWLLPLLVAFVCSCGSDQVGPPPWRVQHADTSTVSSLVLAPGRRAGGVRYPGDAPSAVLYQSAYYLERARVGHADHPSAPVVRR